MINSQFDLESDYIVLDDKEIEVLREKNTDRFYFAERIAVRGELNFGLVAQNTTKSIKLADFGINTPIIIDSIVALSGESTSDEIVFYLYRNINGQRVRVGIQRYSNSQMPTDFPDGIIYPDMELEVKPTRADSSIVVYCKPVKVAFQAIASAPSQATPSR